ncbi:MAG: nucleotidyltransferase domain-containing protein [Fibrobacter sp.]|nr:nucleotidyltransferase domain-containing protein [Fibrobacter sp.]
MQIDLETWINQYIKIVKALFGSRLLFIGLQGSYGRDEADEKSDIDMVVILDILKADDLKAYDNAISGLPYRDKICGFISGKQELFNWSKADLFQFYHDTTPLLGELKTLLPQLTRCDIRNAILTGACNIYHLCGHNIIHEKDPGILKSLYKGAVFVIQALYYYRTGIYIKKHSDLIEKVSPEEHILLKTYLEMKCDQLAQEINFYELSRVLFDWAGQIIKEYGEEGRV